MNDQNHSNDMSRREFLKIVGISTATTTAVFERLRFLLPAGRRRNSY